MDKLRILIQLDNAIFSKKVENILDKELIDSELWYWEANKKTGTFLLTVPNQVDRSLSLMNTMSKKLEDKNIHCIILPVSSKSKAPMV